MRGSRRKPWKLDWRAANLSAPSHTQEVKAGWLTPRGEVGLPLLELARPLPDASAVSSFARCRRRHGLLRRIGLASMLELAAGLPSRQSKAGRRANKERSFVSDLRNALTLEEVKLWCFTVASSLVWPRLQSGVWLSHLPRPHSIIQRARGTSSCRSRRGGPTTLLRGGSARSCRHTSDRHVVF